MVLDIIKIEKKLRNK